MAVNDLTGQQIQNTYQRVIQTDGNLIADGTGSELPIKFEGSDLIVSGALRANSYIVSESHVNVSSGSTVFGNSHDDTHTFSGSVDIKDRTNTNYNAINTSLFIRQDAIDRSQIANGFGGSIDFHTQRGTNSSGARTARITSRLTHGAQTSTEYYAIDFNLRSNDTQIDLMTLHTSNTNLEGRVGILDTTPTYTLDVNGDFRSTGGISTTNISASGHITASGHISASAITASSLSGHGSTTGLVVNGFVSSSQLLIQGDISSSENLKIVGSASIGNNLAVTGNVTSGTWNGTPIAHDYIGLDAIDGTNIADDAINSEHYTDASIDHAHLANDCVDGDNIADDSINSEHYVDASIDTAHIADNQVTYAKIQNVSATDRILGRDSAGAGVIEEITPANLRTMLNVADGANANVSGDSGNAAVYDNSGTPTLKSGITQAEMATALGYENGADVTDATNVAAAGALMSSNLLDQDDMADNDATKPASQQSIKAYVDNNDKIILTAQALFIGTPGRNEIIFGNTNNGFDADAAATLFKEDTSPASISLARNLSHGGIVVPFDITNLDFKCAYRPAQTADSSNGGIDRPYASKAAGANFNSGEQSTFTVRFYIGDRADDSNSAITLTQVGSVSDIPNSNKHYFNLDLSSPITSFDGASSITAGKLLFIGFEFTNENAHTDLDEFTNGHVKVTYTLFATPA